MAVPSIVNLTSANASTAITAAGFVVGTITNALSATVPAGVVISQNPAAVQLPTTSPVDFVVSSGPPGMVSVPDVVNQTQAAAATSFSQVGLVVGTITSARARRSERAR